jgi:hypothetical protein
MLLSAVTVLVVAQSISEILEGLMNNSVYCIYVFFYKEKFVICMRFIILCLSVHLFACVTTTHIGWIFTKFDFGDL